MNVELGATTRLFFVRHGQTTLSSSDAFCGIIEVPLTEVGRQQAQNAATRLSRERIDALYCSPQGRARETAEPLASALGLPILVREPLHEMNFGKWEGRVQADVAVAFPREMAAWERGSWAVHPPEGETQQDVLARVVPCIVELSTIHAGQTIAIISHRTTLRLLIGHLLNLSLLNSRALHVDPASVSELLITGDQVELVRFNDTSHLVRD
jgi:broad specificity phosphatase PhoE